MGAFLLLILTAATRGHPFVSEEASFSVSFPSDPIQDTMTVPTGEGPQLRRVFRYADDEVIYFVVHTCMPPPTAPGDPQALLDQGRDGGLRMTDGKLISEERIIVSGHPGRDLVEEVAGQRSYSRIFVGDAGAFYSLTAGPRSMASKGKALAFLESFKMLPHSRHSACQAAPKRTPSNNEMQRTRPAQAMKPRR